MSAQDTAHRILGIDGTMHAKTQRTSDKLFDKQRWTASRTKGKERLAVEIRFDDQCKNRHMDFSVTATLYEGRRYVAGGCMHEEIVKWFPELAPLIKWHLKSTDGLRHYVANTVYHAKQHGPTHAWVFYFTGHDPLMIGDGKERLVGYVKADEAKRAEGIEGYHARSCAVWPEATDEELTASKEVLIAALNARLPTLLSEFKIAMTETCGFEWREVEK